MLNRLYVERVKYNIFGIIWVMKFVSFIVGFIEIGVGVMYSIDRYVGMFDEKVFYRIGFYFDSG